jgi:hypothetical protein
MIQPRLEYHTAVGQQFITRAFEAATNRDAARHAGEPERYVAFFDGVYFANVDVANFAETGATEAQVQAYIRNRAT